MGQSTIFMAIFNSYFDITRGYQWLQLGYFNGGYHPESRNQLLGPWGIESMPFDDTASVFRRTVPMCLSHILQLWPRALTVISGL